jgi:ribonuclease Z
VAKVVILGTSNAIPDAEHENTHMAIVGKERSVLIDCVSNPILRLRQAGVDFDQMTDLILTHFHPDHVSGVPSLLMNMWLLGRKRALTVHGLSHTLDRMENLMGFYEWKKWPDFFPVTFHHMPEQEMNPVLETMEFRIYSSPVHHFIPTIGLRVEFLQTDKVMAYSCDTQPCEEVVRLAAGADVLIHEASGATFGHSSAAQAGEIARQAEVGSLYLIHYPTGGTNHQALTTEAENVYGGPVALAKDFMHLEF